MSAFKHHPNRCTEACEDGEAHCYPCIVFNEGIAEERARVVAFLRANEVNTLVTKDLADGWRVTVATLTPLIEAGEHVDAKAEGGHHCTPGFLRCDPTSPNRCAVCFSETP